MTASFRACRAPIGLVLRPEKERSGLNASGMLGKVGEVKQWQGLRGKIFVNGEIWNASSDTPLSQGDRAVIERVEGFVLTVKRVPTICHSRSIQ